MWLFDKLMSRDKASKAGQLWDDVQISPSMATSIKECLNLFYNVPDWRSGLKLSGLATIMCNHLGNLTTSELKVSCGTSPRAEWLEKQAAPILGKMCNAVQMAAAGGQAVLRPYVDGDSIRFEIVQAGRFFPTRYGGDGKPTAGFFTDYRDTPRGDFVRVEKFDLTGNTLTITNTAYRNNDSVMGGEVPLASVPEWEHLQDEVVIQNVSAPLFGVIVMPFVNTVDDSSPMPVSLYANALPNLEEFDRLYTEFLYELHSGKRKRIVERSALTPNPRPGEKATLSYRDVSTDTYVVIDPEEPGKPFDDYTPAIRAADYVQGLKTVLALIENQCYMSPGTFSIDDRTGAITATQVVSNDRTTYNTCAAIQQGGIKAAIEDALTAANILADLYKIAPAGDIDISISFGDSVFEDTASEFARQLQMVTNKILKPEKLLAWYFGVDDETAKKEYLQQADEGESDIDLFGGA